MRGLILLCLLAAVYADDGGYEYKAVSQSDDDLLPNFAQESSNLMAQKAELPFEHNLAENSAQQTASLNPEFEKEFYTFSAPDSAFDDGEATQKLANALKRNIRVLFIKSPENSGFEEAALNLAKQASQERSAIYVLSKQADIGDLAEKLQNLNSQSNNKPEVKFVKYRTANDAINAQKAIQEQYDSLPGSSHSVNGGNAPVLNFASRAPISKGYIPPGPGHQYLPIDSKSSSKDYLPPSLHRFRYRL